MAGHKCSTHTYSKAYAILTDSTAGHSSDLKQRLADHNAGNCPHTAKFAPWKLRFYAAFETLRQAQQFEAYLKTRFRPCLCQASLALNPRVWVQSEGWCPPKLGCFERRRTGWVQSFGWQATNVLRIHTPKRTPS